MLQGDTHPQSHCTTLQHQGQQKVRQREKQKHKSYADRQCSLKISSLADSGSYGSQLAKRIGGKQTDFKINVPPYRNSLSLWLNSCKGRTERSVCCIGALRLCLVLIHKCSAQKLMWRAETLLSGYLLIHCCLRGIM